MNRPDRANLTTDLWVGHSDSGDLITTARNFTTQETPIGKPAPDLPPITGYRVLGEIAQGGMGMVFAAFDLSLERDLALKILLPGRNPENAEGLKAPAELNALIKQ